MNNTNGGVLTERIVDTEVETTVDDDTNNGGDEATIETSNTIRGKGLPVDIDETVELTSSSTLGRLGIVGKTSTGVVEGVNEEERRGTSGTTRRDVTGEPLPVPILLLETEQGLEIILCECHVSTKSLVLIGKRTEGEVQCLRREVPDDVGSVSSPERNETLIAVGAGEAVDDTLVGGSETTLLDLQSTVRYATHTIHCTCLPSRPGSAPRA